VIQVIEDHIVGYMLTMLLALPGLGYLVKRLIHPDTRNTHMIKRSTGKLIRSVVITIYIMLVPFTIWVLKDHSLSYIVERVVPYGIPPLLSFICATFLSIFVIGIEYRSTEAILFCLLSLGYSLLNLDILLVGIVPDIHLALTISRLDHFYLALFMLGGNLHLTYLVANKKTGWWPVYLSYAFGLIMAPLTQTRYYLKGMYRFYWGFFAHKAVLYSVISGLWFTAFIYAIYLFYKAYKNSQDIQERTKLKYVLMGFVAAAALSLTNTPALYGHEVYPLGTFTFIPLLLISYGLFKNNIRIALQSIKTLSLWSTTILMLLSISLASAWIARNSGVYTMVCIGTISAVLLHSPVKRLLDTLFDLIARNSSNHLADEYYILSQKLSGIQRPKELHDTISQWFFTTLMSSNCMTLFYDKDKGSFTGWHTWNPDFGSDLLMDAANRPTEEKAIQMDSKNPFVTVCSRETGIITHGKLLRWLAESDDTSIDKEQKDITDIIIPVRSKGQLLSILLIGPRVDGLSYTMPEKQVMLDMGMIMGPYIENARILEELEDTIEKRTQELNKALVESLIKEKEITQRNGIIVRQNQVFRALFQTSTMIHQTHDLDELFGFILDQLHSLFSNLGFCIMLHGDRPGILESAYFLGISEEEKRLLMENRARLLDEDINKLMDPVHHQDVGAKGHISSGVQPVHWTVMAMNSSNKKSIGKIIIKGEELDQTSREVVQMFISQVSAVAMNKLLMKELEKLANTDALTGVFNRFYFNAELSKAIVNSRRFPALAFSVIMVDINGLKRVNDELGHEKGDEMIVKVADLLRSVSRKSDVVARIGGDEFAIILPSTGLTQASRLCTRIRTLEKGLFLNYLDQKGESKKIAISISLGVASSESTDPERILSQADKLMYKDKSIFYSSNTSTA